VSGGFDADIGVRGIACCGDECSAIRDHDGERCLGSPVSDRFAEAHARHV
jgi:hypothetical protein